MRYQTRTAIIGTTASERAQQDPGARIFGLFSMATLNRHRALLAACIMLAAVAGVALALTRTPTYTTSARILIENRQLQVTNQQDVILAEAFMDAVRVQNQIEVLRSEDLLLALAERIGPVAMTEGLRDRIMALIPGPYTAAPPVSDPLQRTRDHLRDNFVIERVGNSHAIDVSYSDGDAGFAYTAVSDLVELYLEQAEARALDAAQIASPWLRDRLSAVGANAVVINSPRVADRPDGPGPLRLLAMSLVLGGMLGGALSFWREFRDTHVRTAADVEHLAGVPCVGIVPNARAAATGRSASILDAPDAPGRVALLRVRQAIGRGGSTGRVIGIAEPAATEDASLIARELARMLSREDPATLLVRVSVGHGSDLERDDALGIDAVDLDAEEFTPAALFARLKGYESRYRFIVVSFPPLIPGLEVQGVHDALDDLLMVVRWGDVSRNLVAHASDKANEAGKLRGTILTRVPLRRLRHYSVDEYRLLHAMRARETKKRR
jgi:polysaccharide biosynthesis transport protein